MGSLKGIYRKYNLGNPPYWCDKESRHGYLSLFYADFFEQVPKDLTLLEIGVLCGGSLLMWSEFFPQGTIYGIDKQDIILDEIRSRENIRFIQADAYDVETLSLIPDCDVIIDDGSHGFENQKFVIENYYSKLKPGGTMIIEDVHLRRSGRLVKTAIRVGCASHIVRKEDWPQRDSRLIVAYKGV